MFQPDETKFAAQAKDGQRGSEFRLVGLENSQMPSKSKV